MEDTGQNGDMTKKMSEDVTITSEQNVIVAENNVKMPEKDIVVIDQNIVAIEQNTVSTEQNMVATEQNTVATEQNTVATEQNKVATEQNTVATEKNTVVTDKNTLTSETLEPDCKRVKYPETLESFIDNIVNYCTKKNLKSVLSDEFLKPLPFVKVYVGQVKKVKDLSKIILLLNQKLPLKELSHLKRACRKEVILFPVDFLKSQTDSSIQYYIEENFNELRGSFEYFKITDVPAIAPKTRKQYVECGRSWSCNFHPDKYLEKFVSDEVFTEEEIKNHRLFMGIAFEVAIYYLKRENANLEPYDLLTADLNATVVVDPSNQSVVAVAFDNRVNHPIQHSAMLAIDNVAKTQNGGAWNTFDIDSVDLRGIGYMDLLLHLKHKYPDVKFGAKTYISKSDIDENQLCATESPYLCTGYYIYLIREPCFMCSMGLVHARSKRVFFCTKNDVGALNTLTKLQCVPSLNHHFEVFTGFL